MLLNKELRKLAKSTYWQNLYQSSIELNGINLFNNINSFSGLQVTFIYWLKIYSSIYENLYSKDYDFLDEKLIEDDIRVDAFIYWRSKQHEAERLKYKEEEKASKHNKNSKPGKKSYCQVDLRGE